MSCRREFEHAVQCGKYMIPVLIPAFKEQEDDIPVDREGETGWMGPVTAGYILSCHNHSSILAQTRYRCMHVTL